MHGDLLAHFPAVVIAVRFSRDDPVNEDTIGQQSEARFALCEIRLSSHLLKVLETCGGSWSTMAQKFGERVAKDHSDSEDV